jgi:hypothetical protein
LQKEVKYIKKKLKNLLIIYESASDYIKRVLSFFKLFCGKENIPLNFYASKWLGDGIENFALGIDENFEIFEMNFPSLNFFTNSIILSLNPLSEKENHKKISEYLKKLKIKQLNPFNPSNFATNKYKTIKKLKKLNINVPDSILIRFKERKFVKEKVERFIKEKNIEEFYVQANSDTEGRQIYFFTQKEIIENFEFFKETIYTILPEQPVIIKEKRGNVYYFKKEEKEYGYRDVVFRFFIFEWNRKIYSDWCFVELSKSHDMPFTSPLKGGKILNFKEIENNLFFRKNGDFEKLFLKEEEKKKIISEVKKIFYFFNKGLKEKLKIGGMDILIETDGEDIKVVFLELNPRPSGLDKLSPFI